MIEAELIGNRWALTKPGRLYLLAILLTFLISYLVNHNLLFMLASTFLALFLYNLAMLKVQFNKFRFHIKNPPELFARRIGTFEIHIENANRMLPVTHASIQVEVEGFDEPLTAPLAQLRPGREAALTFSLEPEKRGWLVLKSVIAESANPFGLVSRKQIFKLEQRLLVFPEVLDHVPELVSAEDTQRGFVSQQTGDYQYLAPYQPGDDVRMIHWKKSTLSVRPVIKKDLVRMRTADPRVFFPDTCNHFEQAIRVLTTWVLRYEGFEEWAVYTTEGLKLPNHRDQMLTILALIQPVSSAGAVELQRRGYRLLFASHIPA